MKTDTRYGSWFVADAKPGPKPTLFYFDGKELSLSDWAKETGISQETLRRRINELGWTIQEAFTVPPSKNNKNIRWRPKQELLEKSRRKLSHGLPNSGAKAVG